MTGRPRDLQDAGQLPLPVGTILKFPDHNDPEHMTAKAQEVALDRLLVDRFKGGDSAFSTWLYQIATNLARNRYWYWWRRKRDQSLSLDAPLSADNENTIADLIPAEQETPEDATVTQEFVNRVAECMEQLNEKHREILILRNVQNLAYEEIAEILGISVGTVKSRIARARESLRELLWQKAPEFGREATTADFFEFNRPLPAVAVA